MKNRAEWLTFGAFVAAVFAALVLLVRRGIRGESAALAIALVAILAVRASVFVWNLRRQRKNLERK